MTTKTASCHCGELKVACEGEPMFVAMCHCEDCQRRTGSSYSMGAWYERSSVGISGNDKLYRRTGEEGMDLSYHFCPNCGANVFWESSTVENAYGVAVGCFADPDFPAPIFSFYSKRQHKWLTIPDEVTAYIEGYKS